MRVIVSSIIIWCTYFISFGLPAADAGSLEDGKRDVISGFKAFKYGWSSGEFGFLPELANVSLLVGWLMFIRRDDRLALIFGFISVVLGSTAPSIYGVKPLEGYYVWVVSFLLLTLASVLGLIPRSKPHTAPG